jgi:hypothetical protein
MGVTVYKSSDGSAPTLNGTAGSLITVLDAVLVNGYGSKSAAGWTKSYSGTNKAAYRQGSGNQFYLRVNDDGPGAGTYKEARVVGYETMSDVDTGTNPMPTVAQFANGMFVRKSAAADSTARSWIIVADNKTFYMFVLTGDIASTYLSWTYGEFYSYLSSDGYRVHLIARTTENNATSSVDWLDAMANTPNAAITGHYLQRNRSGTVGALAYAVCAPALNGFASGFGYHGNSYYIAYPNPEDGGLYLAPAAIIDPTTGGVLSIRGKFRGLWHNLHNPSSFSDGDTFSGVGDFSGKTFLVIKTAPRNNGLFIVETSDTWDTN